jgi:small subunit ribosomal protein S6
LKTIEKKLYEGMFLVDSLEATSDWDGITGLIKNIIQRSDGEIVTLKKWDDRRLMYDIGGKNRGTYILCYFKAPGPRITEIEKDVQLSERIMRALILSAEAMSEADINKETPLELAEKLGQPAAQAEAEVSPEVAEEETVPESSFAKATEGEEEMAVPEEETTTVEEMSEEENIEQAEEEGEK